jgi:hypothetical protein
MIVKVQYAKSWSEVQVQDHASVAELHEAIETQMDIPAHKQKLICKGKVLDNSKLLATYGVADGSKVMLMANGALTQVRSAPGAMAPAEAMSPEACQLNLLVGSIPLFCDSVGLECMRASALLQGQILARKQADARREQEEQRHKERVVHPIPVNAGAPAQQDEIRLSTAGEAMPERLKRWRATGVVSLRDLGLHHPPDGFEESMETLQADGAACITSADVGNNCLAKLPRALPALPFT